MNFKFTYDEKTKKIIFDGIDTKNFFKNVLNESKGKFQKQNVINEEELYLMEFYKTEGLTEASYILGKKESKFCGRIQ